MTGKDSSEACATACQTGTVYSVFPSGMTSRSKIAQFNGAFIWRIMVVTLHQKTLDILYLNLSEYYNETGEVSVGIHIIVYAFRRQTL
jgi:hypothetical protein